MNVQLRFFATFREAVGQKELDWEHDSEPTVGQLLRDLEAQYEGLEGELLSDGEIRPHVNVLKNGRGVIHMEGVETSLEDGDAVSVFPPVAGGASAAGKTGSEGDAGVGS